MGYTSTNDVKLPILLNDASPPFSSSCCDVLIAEAWLQHMQERHAFDIRVLVHIIQVQFDINSIKGYLNAFPETSVRSTLRCPVPAKSMFSPTYPVLFYAAQQNSPELVRVLCEAGANPDHRAAISGLPLLVYLITSAENEHIDVTETLSALLAMGCSPYAVPPTLWANYIDNPVKKARELTFRPVDEIWRTQELLTALARNLTLMQRYFLFKASLIEEPTPRMLQIAKAFDFVALFETHFHIIGQSHSTNQIIRTIVAHYLYDADKPLTLLLTGMSGHGKTEISKSMGALLSLSFHRVDMTEMKYETDLFGPKAPFQGSQSGSALNNFLATNSGKRCVVFLDEFEKTTDGVRQSLLLLLESGFYMDRRHNTPIDASKVIWILAANLGTVAIHEFWELHLKDATPDQQAKAPYESLQRDLESEFTNRLGAPLTGRLSRIVPFFPFTAPEQAVTCYKFMRELWTMVRSPIDVSKKKFARHTYLSFRDDGVLAGWLAKRNYSPYLGARSLEKAVHTEIRTRLAFKQLEVGEKFRDLDNEGSLSWFEVKLVGHGKSDGQGKGPEEDVGVVVERLGEKETLSKKLAREARAGVLVKREDVDEL